MCTAVCQTAAKRRKSMDGGGAKRNPRMLQLGPLALKGRQPKTMASAARSGLVFFLWDEPGVLLRSTPGCILSAASRLQIAKAQACRHHWARRSAGGVPGGAFGGFSNGWKKFRAFFQSLENGWRSQRPEGRAPLGAWEVRRRRGGRGGRDSRSRGRCSGGRFGRRGE